MRCCDPTRSPRQEEVSLDEVERVQGRRRGVTYTRSTASFASTRVSERERDLPLFERSAGSAASDVEGCWERVRAIFERVRWGSKDGHLAPVARRRQSVWARTRGTLLPKKGRRAAGLPSLLLLVGPLHLSADNNNRSSTAHRYSFCARKSPSCPCSACSQTLDIQRASLPRLLLPPRADRVSLLPPFVSGPASSRRPSHRPPRPPPRPLIPC